MPRSAARLLGSLVFVAALLAGCSAAATPVPSTGVPAASAPTETPGNSVTRPSFAAVSPGLEPTGKPVVLPKSVLDPILADAAQRSGVPVAQVVVLTSVSLTWSDTSLGCPEPGKAYAQVMLEGYRVSIRAGAYTYDYRGEGMTDFKLCKSVPG